MCARGHRATVPTCERVGGADEGRVRACVAHASMAERSHRRAPHLRGPSSRPHRRHARRRRRARRAEGRPFDPHVGAVPGGIRGGGIRGVRAHRSADVAAAAPRRPHDRATRNDRPPDPNAAAVDARTSRRGRPGRVRADVGQRRCRSPRRPAGHARPSRPDGRLRPADRGLRVERGCGRAAVTCNASPCRPNTDGVASRTISWSTRSGGCTRTAGRAASSTPVPTTAPRWRSTNTSASNDWPTN